MDARIEGFCFPLAPSPMESSFTSASILFSNFLPLSKLLAKRVSIAGGSYCTTKKNLIILTHVAIWMKNTMYETLQRG
jgi:hypothetical protein